MATALVGFVQCTEAQFSCVTNDGAITITGCSVNAGAVIIPSTTNGYPVVNIGDDAFANHGITSVTIPDSVTNIGEATFYDCTSLASVSLGNGLVTLGTLGFEDCSALTGITFPSSLTSIGSYEFNHCSSLASLTIPNTVTNIGDNAFAYCNDLTNVTIGSGITTFPSYAFYECTSLPGIDIPTNITSIGDYVLSDCTLLTAIKVDPANPDFSSLNGVLFNKNQTSILQYPAGKTTNGYTIPSAVTNIGTAAFLFCTNLTHVTIPNGVTSIGTNAFWGDLNLSGLVIPASVGSIRDSAFEYCTNLTAMYFQGPPPNLGYGPFANDTNLVIYYLPGATGWSSPFSGVTAELWNPKASKFSVTGGHFGFKIIGPTNAVIVVAACTNLANPAWLRVSTNTLTSGASSFTDAQSPNYTGRFYRLRSP
ncbi:MAG TPA: leucine-rich repeat domain-containing protein [Verrucomicrobiae bacterium]|nr:leucine-rich repeat domain-containing protein [Verrucomicrobiae bacterium]